MLRGSLKEFPLPNVLQMLTNSGVSGKLSLEHPRGGDLWLSDGEVVHAQALRYQGDEALDLLASVNEGAFAFLPMAAPAEHSVQLKRNALLRHLTISSDEWQTLLGIFPHWEKPLQFTERWSNQQLVTHGQYRVLNMVGRMSLTDLVAHSDVAPRTTLEILRPFVQSGLVSAG